MKACLLCNSDAEKRLFIARERMYASNEEFEYLECTDCGSVQIREPPSDLSRFYPRDYYSMLGEGSEKPTMRGLRRFLRGARTNYCINRSSSLGWFINKVAPNYFDINREWFAFMSAPTDAEILDVGCGAGELMFNLHVQGFSHLTGIDPFVSVEVTYPGFQLRKATLSQLDNKYHLIMLHHSLEHMADPLRALTEASKL